MKIGYIRVSKHEQNEALQRDALKEAGCEKYFNDVITGSKFERKGLEQLLAFAPSGDTAIVWKLDRLGRSLKDLIETLNLLKDRGVDFISLTAKIDTTTPGGKLIFHLIEALAEFERDLMRERTNAGLVAARARGRVGVGPKNFRQTEKLLWLCAWLKTHITPLTIFAQHLASPAQLRTSILERQKGLRGPPIRPHNECWDLHLPLFLAE
jgi:DNA invertase Pin-like site-specific DNA recombinase